MANASAISRKLNHHVPGLRGKYVSRQIENDVVLTFTTDYDRSKGEQWRHYIAITLRPVYRTSTWYGNSLIISDAS
jgi:hypothetical protein